MQKSSVYFVHNLNKLQQVKLSALWILAILSTILIIITNMASSFRCSVNAWTSCWLFEAYLPSSNRKKLCVLLLFNKQNISFKIMPNS